MRRVDPTTPLLFDNSIGGAVVVHLGRWHRGHPGTHLLAALVMKTVTSRARSHRIITEHVAASSCAAGDQLEPEADGRAAEGRVLQRRERAQDQPERLPTGSRPRSRPLGGNVRRFPLLLRAPPARGIGASGGDGHSPRRIAESPSASHWFARDRRVALGRPMNHDVLFRITIGVHCGRWRR